MFFSLVGNFALIRICYLHIPHDFSIIVLAYGKRLIQCDGIEDGKSQVVDLRFLIDGSNVYNHKNVFRIQLEAKEIQLVFPFNMILSRAITIQGATFVFPNDYAALLIKPS